MGDSHSTELKFEHLTSECLLEVQRYLHELQNDEEVMDRRIKSLEEVEEELDGAYYLQISGLVFYHTRIFLKLLNEKTWQRILEFVKGYALSKTAEKILNFVGQNFNVFAKQAEMLSLSPNEVAYLVKSDFVNANREIDILNFVISWICFDQSRAIHAKNILTEVRYSLMTYSEKQRCSSLLRQLGFDVCQTGHQVRFRNGLDVLVAFGGPCIVTRHSVQMLLVGPKIMTSSNLKTAASDCLTPVVITEYVLWTTACTLLAAGKIPIQQTYFMLSILSIWFGNVAQKCLFQDVHFTLEILEKLLYAVSGDTTGQNNTPTVDKYFGNEDRWEMVAPLPVAVRDLAGCVHENNLFVSGGLADSNTDVNFVWRCNPAGNEWSSVTPLLRARSCHVMTCFGNKLIVVGGMKTHSIDSIETLENVEAYSFESKQWSFVLNLKMPACRSSSVLIGNSTLLFGGLCYRGQNNSYHNFLQIINLAKYLKEENANASHVVKEKISNRQLEVFPAFDDESDQIELDLSSGYEVYKYEGSDYFFSTMHSMKLTEKFLTQGC
ncbi:hypothetical protein HELRODRAFT_193469 [Helobdella robusta]|uniref:BACK domain-containing protein n=1 Tax=Helobdella robusta TaxID=6412 RepID=T1FV11_HELRO|nr:hypothetical protein HELRODRAFT_193469 [Helobdella robusta]ESN95751.1 hypothetical protein HELRODRAFT_193469 [Helobdella robusta]